METIGRLLRFLCGSSPEQPGSAALNLEPLIPGSLLGGSWVVRTSPDMGCNFEAFPDL